MAEEVIDKNEQMASEEKSPNKIKRIINWLLVIIIVALALNITSDRIIPSTDNARVKGYIVPIKPQISANVEDIKVGPNQLVEQGQILATLEAGDYEIQVKRAEKRLELAGQNVGVQIAEVASAQAMLSSATIELENVELQTNRALIMAEKGLVSAAEADRARADLATARSKVFNAKAQLQKAKGMLGSEGEDNVQIQAALLELEQAQLNLERTVVRAPTRGGVSNFSLTEGFYASAGQPIMTFISTEEIWIEAYFRENSLGNVAVGDKVEITLDFAPGEVIEGRVSNVDWGVDWGQDQYSGKLAEANFQTGWLRQTQMLPISVEFDRSDVEEHLRIGGQADVIVYTRDNSVYNWLGKAWIRVLSWASYVR